MQIKKLLAALSLGLASFAASATPLDSLVGNLNIKLIGLTTESNLTAGTNESTWGVGSITQIQGTKGQLWNAGSSDGSYLYYMIYGISDQNIVTRPDGRFDIYNVGATGGVADGKIHLDIYRTKTKIDAIDSDFNASPAGRIDYNSYSLLDSLGPTYLEVVFGQGKQLTDVAGGTNAAADETLATLVQTVTSATLPATGVGTFFAEVVGGTAKASWDTNAVFGGHDFDGRYTLATNGESNFSGVCTDAEVASNVCFQGLINDPIRANKIPEPASLALFGLGLAGLAALRRRRAA